jgi:hypothetical protein
MQNTKPSCELIKTVSVPPIETETGIFQVIELDGEYHITADALTAQQMIQFKQADITPRSLCGTMFIPVSWLSENTVNQELVMQIYDAINKAEMNFQAD